MKVPKKVWEEEGGVQRGKEKDLSSKGLLLPPLLPIFPLPKGG